MSSSDLTLNFDSLNVSGEPMDIPAAVGEASSQKSNRSASSTPRRARSKSGRDKEDATCHRLPGIYERFMTPFHPRP